MRSLTASLKSRALEAENTASIHSLPKCVRRRDYIQQHLGCDCIHPAALLCTSPWRNPARAASRFTRAPDAEFYPRKRSDPQTLVTLLTPTARGLAQNHQPCGYGTMG